MNKMKLFLVLALGLLLTAQVNAQGENYTLKIGDGDGTAGTFDGESDLGSSGDVTVHLDSSAGDSLAGWSFGMCHDSAFVSIADEADIANGSDVAAANNGFPLGFDGKTNIDGQGWTVGAIVNISGAFELAVGSNLEMYVVTYQGDAVGTSDLTFCVIGSPPVEIVVNEGDADLSPNVGDGSFNVRSGPPPFTFRVADQTVNYSLPPPAQVSFTAVVSIEQTGLLTSAIETSGFSLAIAHDKNVIAYDLVDTNPGPVVDMGPDVRDIGVLAAVQGGIGPGFLGINDPAGGMTVGCVYNVSGSTTLAFNVDGGEPVLELHMHTVEGALSGVEGECDQTVLEFREDLGSPIVPNVIVADGGTTSYSPADGSLALDNGTIQFCPVTESAYVSGDCNDDAKEDIADAVFLLNHLFHPPGQASPAPDCLAACDVNGDDKVNQADAIYVLNHQFLDGPAPTGPSECGSETAPDCEDHSSCQ